MTTHPIRLAVLGMAAIGVYSYQRLPIDAVPDITNVQVQVNTYRIALDYQRRWAGAASRTAGTDVCATSAHPVRWQNAAP